MMTNLNSYSPAITALATVCMAFSSIITLMNAERPYTDLNMNIKYFKGNYKGRAKIFD